MLDYYLAMTQLPPLQSCSHQDKEKGCTKVKEQIFREQQKGTKAMEVLKVQDSREKGSLKW